MVLLVKSLSLQLSMMVDQHNRDTKKDNGIKVQGNKLQQHNLQKIYGFRFRMTCVHVALHTSSLEPCAKTTGVLLGSRIGRLGWALSMMLGPWQRSVTSVHVFFRSGGVSKTNR